MKKFHCQIKMHSKFTQIAKFTQETKQIISKESKITTVKITSN